jgi:hypothetical protein
VSFAAITLCVASQRVFVVVVVVVYFVIDSVRKLMDTPSYITHVKINLSLCLNKHHATKAYWGSECIAPFIL